MPGQALLTVLHVLPAALMQFMGDQPKPRGKDELALLYELLKVSKNWAPRPGASFLPSCLGLNGAPTPTQSFIFVNSSRHYLPGCSNMQTTHACLRAGGCTR